MAQVHRGAAQRAVDRRVHVQSHRPVNIDLARHRLGGVVGVRHHVGGRDRPGGGVDVQGGRDLVRGQPPAHVGAGRAGGDGVDIGQRRGRVAADDAQDVIVVRADIPMQDDLPVPRLRLAHKVSALGIGHGRRIGLVVLHIAQRRARSDHHARRRDQRHCGHIAAPGQHKGHIGGDRDRYGARDRLGGKGEAIIIRNGDRGGEAALLYINPGSAGQHHLCVVQQDVLVHVAKVVIPLGVYVKPGFEQAKQIHLGLEPPDTVVVGAELAKLGIYAGQVDSPRRHRRAKVAQAGVPDDPLRHLDVERGPAGKVKVREFDIGRVGGAPVGPGVEAGRPHHRDGIVRRQPRHLDDRQLRHKINRHAIVEADVPCGRHVIPHIQNLDRTGHVYALPVRCGHDEQVQIARRQRVAEYLHHRPGADPAADPHLVLIAIPPSAEARVAHG